MSCASPDPRKGTALLEIDHLRADLQRLVKMLRSTKEVAISISLFG